jgi:hypothetical protein
MIDMGMRRERNEYGGRSRKDFRDSTSDRRRRRIIRQRLAAQGEGRSIEVSGLVPA